MNIFHYIRLAFRTAYSIETFHNDATYETVYEVLVPGARVLGRWRLSDIIFNYAPLDVIPVEEWAGKLVDDDLNRLPWNNYYEITPHVGCILPFGHLGNCV